MQQRSLSSFLRGSNARKTDGRPGTKKPCLEQPKTGPNLPKNGQIHVNTIVYDEYKLIHIIIIPDGQFGHWLHSIVFYEKHQCYYGINSTCTCRRPAVPKNFWAQLIMQILLDQIRT